MTMDERVWRIYLSGEIHSDWREQIELGVQEAGLPVVLDAPVTVHEDSDDCGVTILGKEDSVFWHDHKGALLNSVRTNTLIRNADIVVVRFGEKYKQWNAAFDAGFAVALTEGKNIKDSIAFANTTAGLSTTKVGTANSMPHRSEIDKLL